ncbi:hypothetical protein GOQ29_03845 [Clostridium sp. D2Q-14]|uniref:DUF6483 family protein n=1 Tax=Anaeromonas gelatinilytica TaxID=2683194 RepID=UPI00193B4957|nr:DUF6483 family protein [Anaeromonas gelatinilytica]MBS4534745.1 hypothetical protein [Anaeromonas gelatinilytica]
MFQQDYVMKMIEDIVRFLAKVIFNKDTIDYQVLDEENYTPTDYLYKELISLINKGKINEAENLLYEKLDCKDKKHMELALDFYQRLNNFEDDFLEKNNFSREEIEEGLKEVAKKFGIPIYI